MNKIILKYSNRILMHMRGKILLERTLWERIQFDLGTVNKIEEFLLNQYKDHWAFKVIIQ